MQLPTDIDQGRYRHFGYKLGNLYHVGHDFNCPQGTKIYSCESGEVIFSKEVGSSFTRYATEGFS